MNASTAFRLAAVIGFLAVALGAFGAHGLEKLFEKNGLGDRWETASLYHLVHAVVRGNATSPKSRLLLTCFMGLNSSNELIWWT